MKVENKYMRMEFYYQEIICIRSAFHTMKMRGGITHRFFLPCHFSPPDFIHLHFKTSLNILKAQNGKEKVREII
jgi:hypothetical protein